LVQQFILPIEAQKTYTEGYFHLRFQNYHLFGHYVWTAIGVLADDANGKDDAFSNCINQNNVDVCLLKVGEDYRKTAITEWAA
jgi:hypothetical protein